MLICLAVIITLYFPRHTKIGNFVKEHSVYNLGCNKFLVSENKYLLIFLDTFVGHFGFSIAKKIFLKGSEKVPCNNSITYRCF